MEDALLKITNVSKSFGGLCAVDGVSLDVKSGGICGLVGPNGSGKSTLFNTVLGIHQPESGDICFDGNRLGKLEPHQIYGRGLVNAFQVPRLFQKLSVLDNMLVAARGHRGDSLFHSLVFRRNWQEQEAGLAEQALELLELLEISHLVKSPAGELSGGQKKLLEIGRSLMASPKLLLMDEPAAGVNPNLGRKIFERLESLCRSRGLTFFIIEHRLEIFFDFVHWVYVMDKGKIVIEGKPDRIVKDPMFYQVYLGD